MQLNARLAALLAVLCGVLIAAFSPLSLPRLGRQLSMYAQCQPATSKTLLSKTSLAATDSTYKHRTRCTCAQCKMDRSKDRGSSSSSSSSTSSILRRRTALSMSTDGAADSEQSAERERGSAEEGEEEEVQDSEVVSDDVEDAAAANSTEPAAPVDPLQAAILLKEAELSRKLKDLEIYLRSERSSLSRTKDRVSESGKNGYFIVQAQVAEFLKRKEAEQKERVKDNKREFVMQMVPVVDSFRQAPIVAPAATEREENMHATFGSLLKLVLGVFEKYGYKLFDATIGEKYDAARFEVRDLVEVAEGEDGVVLSQTNCGIADNDGSVVRRAKVTVSKLKKA